MRGFAYTLLVLAVGGCTTVAAPRPNGPVPLSRGSVDAFTPLVAASNATPTCEVRPDATLDEGQRAVALVYPESPGQQVTVTLDESDGPVRYVDVRGGLGPGADIAEDRTTIGLYFDGGYAVLSNRVAGDEPTMLEVPLDEALGSDRLGHPDRTLERVLAACG